MFLRHPHTTTLDPATVLPDILPPELCQIILEYAKDERLFVKRCAMVCAAWRQWAYDVRFEEILIDRNDGLATWIEVFQTYINLSKHVIVWRFRALREVLPIQSALLTYWVAASTCPRNLFLSLENIDFRQSNFHWLRSFFHRFSGISFLRCMYHDSALFNVTRRDGDGGPLTLALMDSTYLPWQDFDDLSLDERYNSRGPEDAIWDCPSLNITLFQYCSDREHYAVTDGPWFYANRVRIIGPDRRLDLTVSARRASFEGQYQGDSPRRIVVEAKRCSMLALHMCKNSISI